MKKKKRTYFDDIMKAMGSPRAVCEKTISGNHKWGEVFDGYKRIVNKNGTIIGTPKVIKKCQACGLYDY